MHGHGRFKGTGFVWCEMKDVIVFGVFYFCLGIIDFYWVISEYWRGLVKCCFFGMKYVLLIGILCNVVSPFMTYISFVLCGI